MSVATIIACGVNQEGRREILGVGIGESEAREFWLEFLRGLRQRGLSGAKSPISCAGVSCGLPGSWMRPRTTYWPISPSRLRTA